MWIIRAILRAFIWRTVGRLTRAKKHNRKDWE